MSETKNNRIIHFAPLQGITDKSYRSVFNSEINNVDFFYTPYLSLENSGLIKMHDDIIGLNEDVKRKTIPQILPANLSELKILIEPIVKQDFTILNINMGCPYPMVTRKGRGAALIRKPEIINDLIRYINDYTQLKLSLKLRSGIDAHNEIYSLLDKIQINKVRDIIIHPRIAKQLYKGQADIEVFKKCNELYPSINFIYNGDIMSINDYELKLGILGKQKEWMLGRGLIENPFLAWQIKNLKADLPSEFDLRVQKFAIHLLQSIKTDSKEKGHALNRIKHQLNLLFRGNKKYKKLAKKIKKTNELKGVEQLLIEFNF